jgi:hypothetical protein
MSGEVVKFPRKPRGLLKVVRSGGRIAVLYEPPEGDPVDILTTDYPGIAEACADALAAKHKIRRIPLSPLLGAAT